MCFAISLLATIGGGGGIRTTSVIWFLVVSIVDFAFCADTLKVNTAKKAIEKGEVS